MITRVRPAQLAAWFAANAAGTQPLVLDVREPWELQTASVRAEGFELRAIPMGEIPARLGAVVGTDPVMRFTLVRREGERFVTTSSWDTTEPRLVNFPEPSSFSL